MSHISRMCSAMSWGMPSGGRGMFGLSSVGRQPWSWPALPARSIRCSTSRTESRYSSSLRRSVVLTWPRRSFASASTASRTLSSPLRRLVLEQPVERQGRVELQRRRRGRRAPRDVRAVEHRVVPMHRRVRLLAGQHQARHLGRSPVPLGDHLVHARPRADLAARGQRRAREQVARLRAVDVPLLGLLVVQAADEQHLLAEVGRAARAPCRAPGPSPRPWPTTRCCGSRCRRRAPPAAPAARSAAPGPTARRPRPAATPARAAPSRRPGRGASIVARGGSRSWRRSTRDGISDRRFESIAIRISGDSDQVPDPSRQPSPACPRWSRNGRLRTIVSSAAREAIAVRIAAAGASRRSAARRRAARRGPGRSPAACGRSCGGTPPGGGSCR